MDDQGFDNAIELHQGNECDVNMGRVREACIDEVS